MEPTSSLDLHVNKTKSNKNTFISMAFLSCRLLKSESITLSAPAVISLVIPRGRSPCLEKAHKAVPTDNCQWHGGHQPFLLGVSIRSAGAGQAASNSTEPPSTGRAHSTGLQHRNMSDSKNNLQVVTQINPCNI